jgi:hypothetical protein
MLLSFSTSYALKLEIVKKETRTKIVAVFERTKEGIL